MLSGTLGQVEPYQQTLRYSCSCASLLAVLRHYGITDYSEEDLMPLVGLSSIGAWPYQIVHAAHALGLAAFELRLRSLADAVPYLGAGIPIICEVASWTMPGRGHFVVLVSMDGQTAEIMDPNTPGNWRSITLDELQQRWGTHGYACVVVMPPSAAALTR